MLLRMQKIRSTLADIKLSLDARQHITLLHENAGLYCLTCSPSEDVPGTCGPTCPLLCPHSRSSQFRGTADNYHWLRNLSSNRATWRGIGGEMDRLGMSVYASTVSRWERGVEKLRGECEASTEVHENEGWRPILPSRRRKEVSFKEGWSFETAWGRGPGMEEEIGPDVVRGVSVKRKRGVDGANALQGERRKRVKR
jgi:hypothetical protein